MLLNLSEDVGVEKKMKKKVGGGRHTALMTNCPPQIVILAGSMPQAACGARALPLFLALSLVFLTPLTQNIVVYLVKMLDRSNVELLILATTFLKKLSIYKENKV